MDAQLILDALRSRGATFDFSLDGRLCVEVPEPDELEDVDVEMIRQHKDELIDLICCDDTDADYDRNERAAIQEEGCTLTVEIPEPDHPKLIVKASEIVARTFTFDELRGKCEAAYRKGVHHALSLASEMAENTKNHDAAIEWINRAESIAEDLRFNRKDEGRGMLLHHIRQTLHW
jgi:hypothetical protein